MKPTDRRAANKKTPHEDKTARHPLVVRGEPPLKRHTLRVEAEALMFLEWPGIEKQVAVSNSELPTEETPRKRRVCVLTSFQQRRIRKVRRRM